MKNMAFSLTTEQVRNGTKTVTRRLGSADFRPGERRMAIEKGQGLKKGEHVKRIRIIECVSNQHEPLFKLLADPDYGRQESIRECFPDMDGLAFMEFFCRANGVSRRCAPNRIEFKYIT